MQTRPHKLDALTRNLNGKEKQRRIFPHLLAVLHEQVGLQRCQWSISSPVDEGMELQWQQQWALFQDLRSTKGFCRKLDAVLALNHSYSGEFLNTITASSGFF